MKKWPVVIIGGGPGGFCNGPLPSSIGRSPLVIERESFDRFHVGESLSGECGADLRKLGLEDELLRQKYPIKRGAKVFNANGVPLGGSEKALSGD